MVAMVNCIFGPKYKCIFVNKLTDIAADWLIAKNCIFGPKYTVYLGPKKQTIVII